MTKKERYQNIIAYFEQHNPHAETELEYESPYQLLVSVILSAQCTDKRVNMTTPAFFKTYPTAEKLAASTAEKASVIRITNQNISLGWPKCWWMILTE